LIQSNIVVNEKYKPAGKQLIFNSCLQTRLNFEV